MLSPTLIELFRYPVKSMMGESLTAIEVTEAGIQGDRAWAVRDERRGGIRGGKNSLSLRRWVCERALMCQRLRPLAAAD